MLWLIVKWSFWIFLGFLLLCELATIRISGLCPREEERREAAKTQQHQKRGAP